jgi:hypothetical protein
LTGTEADLDVVHQKSDETLCSFIQRFSQVHNTIPHITPASIIIAFRQGVRDLKILEKLATHNIQDVVELFNLTNKCA